MFSPQPDSNKIYKSEYVVINKFMGFQVDVDADFFLETAYNPSSLLSENNWRQSRPLYILLGTLFYYPINNIFKLINFDQFSYSSVLSNSDSNTTNKKIKNEYKLSVYAGFIVINGIILLITLLLFDQVLSRFGISREVIILCSIVLIYNLVVKKYFWTPHTQLFNLFCPIYSVYLLINLSNNKSEITQFRIFITSFFNGILLLLYGIFALILPIIIIGFYLNNVFIKKNSSNWKLILIPAYFLFPTLFWIFLLEQFFFGFYSHEIASNQFIWIIDSMKSFNGFFGQLTSNLFLFVKTLTVPTIFFVLIVLQGFYKNIKFYNNTLNPGTAAFIVFLLYLIFLFWMGYYETRLSFTLIPSLLIILAIGIEKNKRK